MTVAGLISKGKNFKGILFFCLCLYAMIFPRNGAPVTAQPWV